MARKSTRPKSTRRFAYNELGEDGVGIIVIKTYDEIKKEYYPYWQEQMRKKFGDDLSQWNFDDCLDDFLVVNWAWELKDDDARTEARTK